MREAPVGVQVVEVRMKLNSTALVLAALMCGAAVAGFVGRPNTIRSEVGGQPPIILERDVPKEFAEWSMVPDQGGQVVNPQTKELLDKLYSQILTRTYVNKDGYRVMLSMAYGDDQRGGLQAHRPEVCYPAQGFKLDSVADGALPTSFGDISVRRLTTKMGARDEPVTYWLTVGDKVIRNSLEKRMVEIRLSLTGQIADGLLFRVSSIDRDAARAFAVQQKFAADLMAAVPADTRRQLSGLTTPAGAG
jgi:EpsI family protein